MVYPWYIPGLTLVHSWYIPEINFGYVPEGYAKYLTNQKEYTLIMPQICYYQFVISKLYLLYPIPI